LNPASHRQFGILTQRTIARGYKRFWRRRHRIGIMAARWRNCG